jgi:hypothetical protein
VAWSCRRYTPLLVRQFFVFGVNFPIYLPLFSQCEPLDEGLAGGLVCIPDAGFSSFLSRPYPVTP